jgi:hypothetical protein
VRRCSNGGDTWSVPPEPLLTNIPGVRFDGKGPASIPQMLTPGAAARQAEIELEEVTVSLSRRLPGHPNSNAKLHDCIP